MDFSKLKTSDRVIAASGLVLFVASLLDWFTVSIEGDGGPLPDHTVLEGLRVPVEGTYDLINVLIRSNGDLRLIMDEASRVQAAPRRSAQHAAFVE